jgi:hypothetical protein
MNLKIKLLFIDNRMGIEKWVQLIATWHMMRKSSSQLLKSNESRPNRAAHTIGIAAPHIPEAGSGLPPLPLIMTKVHGLPPGRRLEENTFSITYGFVKWIISVVKPLRAQRACSKWAFRTSRAIWDEWSSHTIQVPKFLMELKFGHDKPTCPVRTCWSAG